MGAYRRALDHYARELRVRSVMIEVRRGLYIDEATAERSPISRSMARTSWCMLSAWSRLPRR